MYRLNELINNISDEKKYNRGDILSCMFLFAARCYFLKNKNDALLVMQDILILGDVKETAEWEVMEWTIFFLLFIRNIPAKKEEVGMYLKSYREKLLENLKQKKINYAIFLKKESSFGIKKTIKKEVYDRLNGNSLNDIREELEYNNIHEGISEIWVSKVKEISELIYLNYINFQNNFKEVHKLIDNIRILAEKNKLPPFVDFVF